MALDDIEKAAQYQALIETGFRDGGFRHAHILRALSRSVNQMSMEGEPLLSLSWDSRRNEDGEEPDEQSLRVVCSPSWTRMLPGIHRCTKMPGLTKADFFIQAEITQDAQVYLQIETLNSVLDTVADYPSRRVFEMIGTGALELYEFNDVPVSPGLYERLGFWIRGKRTANLGDVDLHGVPSFNVNRGEVQSVEIDGITALLRPNAVTTWNTDGSDDTWAIDHVCIVHDGVDESTPGSTLYEAQIVGVEQRDTQSLVQQALRLFRAPYSIQQAQAFRVSSSPANHFFYAIYELPRVRIVSIDAYTQDREA